MAAYYNEHDTKKAAWLRELIRAKEIADGEVDGRSIEVVQAKDLEGFTQCHFFAGIGGWSLALRLAGWPDTTRIWTGSCPCQSFSQSGKGDGFSDPRHLWPAWFGLIGECRPDIVFGEQVASKAGLAWLDVVSADLEGADYAIGSADICAASVGAPHIRQRLYWVADTNGAGARERCRDVLRGGRSAANRGDALVRDDALAGGATERVAHTDKGRFGIAGCAAGNGGPSGEPHVEQRGEVSALADPDGAERAREQPDERQPDTGTDGRDDAGRSSEDGGLGDAVRAGLPERAVIGGAPSASVGRGPPASR